MKFTAVLSSLLVFPHMLLAHVAQTTSPQPLPQPAVLSSTVLSNATVQAVQRTSPGVKTVLVLQEPVSGSADIDYARYDSYPFRKNLRETAEAFLNKNILNDAEFAVIGYLGSGGEGSVNSPFVVNGVDDQSQQRVQPVSRKGVEKSLAELSRQLTELKKKYYTPELAAFDRMFTSYEEGSLAVPDYALYLDSITPAKTPALKELIAATLVESSINFPKVEAERSRLLAALLTALSSEEVDSLLTLSRQIQVGNVTQAAYYNEVKRLCAAHQISLQHYPELNLYVQYVFMAHAINQDQLFDEIDSHEQEAHKVLAVSAQQAEIVALTKAYYLMRKLVEQRLADTSPRAGL